ncbi:MAG: hypothetical protein U5N86_00655 [Planctomycetota bacterium]|nr:hypothetical protein [Planctomycetota bacterium]
MDHKLWGYIGMVLGLVLFAAVGLGIWYAIAKGDYAYREAGVNLPADKIYINGNMRLGNVVAHDGRLYAAITNTRLDNALVVAFDSNFVEIRANMVESRGIQNASEIGMIPVLDGKVVGPNIAGSILQPYIFGTFEGGLDVERALHTGIRDFSLPGSGFFYAVSNFEQSVSAVGVTGEMPDVRPFGAATFLQLAICSDKQVQLVLPAELLSGSHEHRLNLSPKAITLFDMQPNTWSSYVDSTTIEPAITARKSLEMTCARSCVSNPLAPFSAVVANHTGGARVRTNSGSVETESSAGCILACHDRYFNEGRFLRAVHVGGVHALCGWTSLEHQEVCAVVRKIGNPKQLRWVRSDGSQIESRNLLSGSNPVSFAGCDYGEGSLLAGTVFGDLTIGEDFYPGGELVQKRLVVIELDKDGGVVRHATAAVEGDCVVSDIVPFAKGLFVITGEMQGRLVFGEDELIKVRSPALGSERSDMLLRLKWTQKGDSEND